MNESNPWENRLRAWTPRRPSARLEGKLFRGNDAGSSLTGWDWLRGFAIPATALIVVAVVVLAEHSSTRFQQRDVLLITSAVGSNNIAVANRPDSRQSQWNAVQVAWILPSFDWTNTGFSPSSVSSFAGGTNGPDR